MISSWKDLDPATVHILAEIGRRYPIEERGDAFNAEVAAVLNVDPADVPGIMQVFFDTFVEDISPALQAMGEWVSNMAEGLLVGMSRFTETVTAWVRTLPPEIAEGYNLEIAD